MCIEGWMNMNKLMKELSKNRYNIVLTNKQREIIKKIAKLENQTMSSVIGFAVEKLDELYK